MGPRTIAGRWRRPNLDIRFGRGVALITLVALLASALAPRVAAQDEAGDPASTSGAALVTFETADGSTFRAALSDPADIALAQEALAGDGYAGIPIGDLAPGDGGVNAPHAWHMVDTTFAEFTIELCDGTATMVDEDLDYWLDTVGQFCPWSAVVLDVQVLDNGTDDTDDPGVEPPAGDADTVGEPTTLPTTGAGTGTTTQHASKSMILVIVGLAALAGFVGTQRTTRQRASRRADVRIRDDNA